MADSLEKQVEQFLRAGETKNSILRKLESDENRARLIYFLNNKSLIQRRHKYMWVNLFLGVVLLVMTIKLLLGVADIIAAQGVGWYLLVSFIVPTINFYILREIFLFHRTGYQFLTVLTTLSLVAYSANRAMPDLLFNLGMIALGIFLYLKLFPKSEVIKFPKK